MDIFEAYETLTRKTAQFEKQLDVARKRGISSMRNEMVLYESQELIRSLEREMLRTGSVVFEQVKNATGTAATLCTARLLTDQLLTAACARGAQTSSAARRQAFA